MAHVNRLTGQRARVALVAWVCLAPALALYVAFVVWPWLLSVDYSFYDWDGIGAARFVGLANYVRIATDPELVGSLGHSAILLLFFCVLPVGLGLVLVAVVGRMQGRFAALARTVLFIPQVIPLVAAGIAWKWMYASDGPVNSLLGAVGLGGLARPWLSDFELALPAVGLIGTWTLVGFCVVLLLAGVARIDPALYEAARLDGAGTVAEFRAVTLPGIRREIGIAVMVTAIAAVRVFDVVFVTTEGGPGRATSVPGILIYQLAFTTNQVGLASALGVVLAFVTLSLVLLIRWLMGVDA
jgi:raffinose/stachyose/melibiose transport system permease protein